MDMIYNRFAREPCGRGWGGYDYNNKFNRIILQKI
jgi:hypothetical protein